jgi:hypothetical protein
VDSFDVRDGTAKSHPASANGTPGAAYVADVGAGEPVGARDVAEIGAGSQLTVRPRSFVLLLAQPS